MVYSGFHINRYFFEKTQHRHKRAGFHIQYTSSGFFSFEADVIVVANYRGLLLLASGRLNATSDRVHGVVETNRPALKNAQTDTVIRKGDILLNSIQRLSKVLY